MEGLVSLRPAEATALESYRGRRVLVTGHTGFKGSWLTVWLARLGADVTGLALRPASPSLFQDADIATCCQSTFADVRDPAAVAQAVRSSRPEIVFHLAAQALVREGYADPAFTFGTNVLGVVNLLEALRGWDARTAVVVVTSDKCYDLRYGDLPRSEMDPLGGDDPYSASKAAAELAVGAYRSSTFPSDRLDEHGVAVATARAGNVIGGGDWAADRIVPDAIRALAAGRPIPVRNPKHVRPWQHVLEPLLGYLLLGARLRGPRAASHCEPWNFGPEPSSTASVEDLVGRIIRAWGDGRQVNVSSEGDVKESAVLRLSIEKARERLGWQPRWGLDLACAMTVAWYRAHATGLAGGALVDLCLAQIEDYTSAAVVVA